MTTAYSYIRFSSKRQAHGDSLRRQTAKAQAYCLKNGIELDRSLNFQDLGVSAFRGANADIGGLAAFLQAVETGQVPKGSILIVESLNRLTRAKLKKAQALILSILASGIQIVTLSPERMYSEADDDLGAEIEILITLYRAHEESQTKSQRIKSVISNSQEQARKSGKAWHGRPPMWINKVDSKWELDAKKAATIRRIVDLALSGIGGCNIGRMLNREKLPTFTNSKRGWDQANISRLLRSKALIGQYQMTKPDGKGGRGRVLDGDPIENYYPAVISEEKFYRLQATIESRTIKGTHTGPKLNNLFDGIAFSGQDGGKLTLAYSARRGPQSMKLVSDGYKRGSSRMNSFPYLEFEKHIIQWVSEIDLNLNPLPNDDTGEIKGRLVDVQSKIQKIEKRVDDGENFDRLLDMLSKYSEQERKLKKELEQAKAKTHRTPITRSKSEISQVSQRVGKLSLIEREQLRSHIKNVIARIDCFVYGNKVTRVVVCKVLFSDDTRRNLAINKTRLRESFSIGDNWRSEHDIDADMMGRGLAKINPYESLEEAKDLFWKAVGVSARHDTFLHLLHRMGVKSTLDGKVPRRRTVGEAIDERRKSK